MEGNGIQKELEKIQAGVDEIKDDLSHSINSLAIAVNGLTAKFDNWIRVAENSIPIKAVFWMFLILVLAMVGVEGVQAFAKVYLGGN